MFVYSENKRMALDENVHVYLIPRLHRVDEK